MLRSQYIIFVVLSVFLRQFCAQTNQHTANRELEAANNCKCVRYIDCDANSIINNSSSYISSVIEPRMSLNNRRIVCKGGKFEGYYVCCREKNSMTVIYPPYNRNNTEPEQLECGRQKSIITDRIYADDEMAPGSGEYPWLASIFKKNDFGQYVFVFSGTLIHPKVILTANHGVHRNRAKDFKVVVNGKIERPTIGNTKSEERNVVEIVQHVQFHSKMLYYDAALLILDKPYVLNTNFVNTICMPPNDINMTGLECMVAGWGKSKEKEDSKILRKVVVPLVEHSRCENMLKSTRLGSKFELHKTFVCAGGEENRDACKGDGGSPLMCPFPSDKSKYFQAGIVSWGINCGLRNVPGVYTNVGELRQWIRDELLERLSDFDS